MKPGLIERCFNQTRWPRSRDKANPPPGAGCAIPRCPIAATPALQSIKSAQGRSGGAIMVLTYSRPNEVFGERLISQLCAHPAAPLCCHGIHLPDIRSQLPRAIAG